MTNGATVFGMTWHQPDTALYKAFVHAQSAGGVLRVQLVGTPPANTWLHFCVTWDGTTMRVYQNGILNNSGTGTNPFATDPTVTVLAYDNGASGFDGGKIGEVTVWNVTLTPAEVLSIGTGTLATTVQNSAIIFYSTCNTGDPGQIGPALTNNGATINRTYFESSDGGIKMGGDQMPPLFVQRWTMSGGITMGGDQMATKNIYPITMTGGLALGSDSPVSLVTSDGSVVVASGRSLSYTTK